MIDMSHKAFWDACFHKVNSYVFQNEEQMGLRWQIEKDWEGITTFVVPCQPQGHIPEMRIPHRGKSILFQHQHILELYNHVKWPVKMP